MRVDIIGAGPGGLFLSTLLKRQGIADEVNVFERNAEDASAGWGLVFPDGALAELGAIAPDIHEEIVSAGTTWTPVEIRYRGTVRRVEGNRFHGIPRNQVQTVLRRDARRLGVKLHFGHRTRSIAEHGEADLVVGADGVGSVIRSELAETFRPAFTPSKFHFGWFGVELPLPYFTYAFAETEWGLFQGYFYPSGQGWCSLILYVSDDIWQRSGLSEMDLAESLRFCETVFAEHLDGKPILPRDSEWSRFRLLECENWHTDDVVLIGDAAHTAHWSIGSGTRLALEDAIALAGELKEQPGRISEALAMYEKTRRPRVEQFQKASLRSERHFDHAHRYLGFEPVQFAYQLLARSWRISHDDIARLDPPFAAEFNEWFHTRATGERVRPSPSPAFTPLSLGPLELANRIVTTTGEPGAGLILVDGTAGIPPAPVGPVPAAVRLAAADAGLSATAAELGYRLLVLDLGDRLTATVPPAAELREASASLPVVAAFGLDEETYTGDGLEAVIALAASLKESGVDGLLLSAAEADPLSAGRVVQVSDLIRNTAGVVVIADDGLTTVDEADTTVASARADLVVLNTEETE
ncbi:FAD-dependent monooxygenase [Amycolatopsis roodepoortensis]|uniref:FAD-dependent monooxygenase n=1 Tax=Amycolatopsis roodepoortensis TaxID=700274 RepID=UPI00214C00B0|nr:FAD-dependent monooxygenase [Amycolatopsis roodepoortensis]UUV29034.1 FAD-dependent monooxygenase [Amycolatopsis roodepoortensis]